MKNTHPCLGVAPCPTAHLDLGKPRRVEVGHTAGFLLIGRLVLLALSIGEVDVEMYLENYTSPKSRLLDVVCIVAKVRFKDIDLNTHNILDEPSNEYPSSSYDRTGKVP